MPRSPSRSGSVSPPRRRPVNRSPVSNNSPARSPPPVQAVQNDKEPRLFVSGLSLEATEEDVRNLFSAHGQIVDFFMKKNQRGGIAFITFGTVEEAEKGKECHGSQLNGQSIRVDFAKPRGTNNDRGNNRQRPPRNNGQFNNRGDRPKTCHKCQKEGHFARECTQTVQGNQTSRGDRPKTCFKCKKEGHFSRQCPQAGNQVQVEQRKPKHCFKCQKDGHFAKQCTEEVVRKNDQSLHLRRQNQEIRPFRRRETQTREPYTKKMITQPQEIFPPGRQDYICEEQTNDDQPISQANRFNERNNNRGMSTEEPEQRRNFARKRSVSNSPSPAKIKNTAQLATPQRNQRKKSVSHSPSPMRNRPQNEQKENAYSGLILQREANVSRSRSRSKQKGKLMQRKRSVSKDSNSY